MSIWMDTCIFDNTVIGWRRSNAYLFFLDDYHLCFVSHCPEPARTVRCQTLGVVSEAVSVPVAGAAVAASPPRAVAWADGDRRRDVTAGPVPWRHQWPVGRGAGAESHTLPGLPQTYGQCDGRRRHTEDQGDGRRRHTRPGRELCHW